MCEGGGGVISPNKFKKKRINQFSEKINKKNLGPNFFDLKLTWPKLFSNRAYPETCVSSELLRACFLWCVTRIQWFLSDFLKYFYFYGVTRI